MRRLIGGIEAREQCEVAGLDIGAWVQLYMACTAYVMGSPVRFMWPDGRSLLEQPAITVSMFQVIAEEVAKEQTAESDRAKQQRN